MINLAFECNATCDGHENILSMLQVQDQSMIWNTELVEAIELQNMMLICLHVVYAAENRKESRGSHARDDFKVFTQYLPPSQSSERLIRMSMKLKKPNRRKESTSTTIPSRSKARRNGRTANTGANTLSRGLGATDR